MSEKSEKLERLKDCVIEVTEALKRMEASIKETKKVLSFYNNCVEDLEMELEEDE